MTSTERNELEELLDKLRELDSSKKMLWCLQGVIQDAIAARGWHSELCRNYETEKYVSLVVPSDNETWLDCIEADSPAEALLAAYIQALEAEAAR